MLSYLRLFRGTFSINICVWNIRTGIHFIKNVSTKFYIDHRFLLHYNINSTLCATVHREITIICTTLNMERVDFRISMNTQKNVDAVNTLFKIVSHILADI